ncbi:unnamed protein product [Rotaria magnacalcarata]|uniref:Uncharacterized protein n=1 Tax=Rotaria magnacalcarata TaxID=392030 RepID=A0A815LVP0_9BILA|nr:unnamed protein product [Rotaria magnacalcarata]CAF5204443.1 unnamed protein product [Rotaria magnacalcarata]
MQFILFIVSLVVSIVQTLDYDINNQQVCTRNPFMVNFHHNCSRTRLIQDVNIVNDNRVLQIAIIFSPQNDTTLLPINTSLNIIRSSNYNQTVYFMFYTILGQQMVINSEIKMQLNPISIGLYSYDTFSTQFIPWTNSIYLANLNIPFLESLCLLKDKRLYPPEQISRCYYLFTDETNLTIDLSKSSSHISSFLNLFDGCFVVETSLTTLAIVLIVIVSVFSFISLVLVGLCLKKQLRQLYEILENFIRHKRDEIPSGVFAGTPTT